MRQQSPLRSRAQLEVKCWHDRLGHSMDDRPVMVQVSGSQHDHPSHCDSNLPDTATANHAGRSTLQGHPPGPPKLGKPVAAPKCRCSLEGFTPLHGLHRPNCRAAGENAPRQVYSYARQRGRSQAPARVGEGLGAHPKVWSRPLFLAARAPAQLEAVNDHKADQPLNQSVTQLYSIGWKLKARSCR